MVKLHHLNCVEIESPIGIRAIGHCLLLEMEDRLILIDTGIGSEDNLNPQERIGQDIIDLVGFKFKREQSAIRQIEKLGLNPRDVTDCIITHFDNDHVSGLTDFPNAVVHVGLEEFESFISGNPRYLRLPLAHNPQIRTYGKSEKNWLGFEARPINLGIDFDLFFIPLFGHTFGQCGVAIKVEKNWVFYVADAYYLKIELEYQDHPVNELAEVRAEDNRQRINTLNKIRELAQNYPEIEIFGYHDPSEFEKFKNSN